MTPKEKAHQLYETMFERVPGHLSSNWQHTVAKDCSVAAADEVLGEIWNSQDVDFWKEVKEELQKL